MAFCCLWRCIRRVYQIISDLSDSSDSDFTMAFCYLQRCRRSWSLLTSHELPSLPSISCWNDDWNKQTVCVNRKSCLMWRYLCSILPPWQRIVITLQLFIRIEWSTWPANCGYTTFTMINLAREQGLRTFQVVLWHLSLNGWAVEIGCS